MLRSLTAKLLTLAILLPLMGCATSSPPPAPLIQTVQIKELPPASLLAYPPSPELPDIVSSRDDMRDLALRFAAWGEDLKARLDAIKAWETQAQQPEAK